jgi:hypothetical protein
MTESRFDTDRYTTCNQQTLANINKTFFRYIFDIHYATNTQSSRWNSATIFKFLHVC